MADENKSESGVNSAIRDASFTTGQNAKLVSAAINR